MNEKIKVFLIKKGCPLCHSDVIGNDEIGYYCKHCNILFSFDQLNKESLEEKQPVQQLKEPSEKENKFLEHEPFDDKQEDDSEINTCGNEKTSFVASKLSNKFHIPQCPFAKNIKKENLITFSTEEEAIKAGFKPCKCVKEV